MMRSGMAMPDARRVRGADFHAVLRVGAIAGSSPNSREGTLHEPVATSMVWKQGERRV